VGAAYLIDGGCSDDAFTDFCYGLIASGRRVFETALAAPDNLAGLRFWDKGYEEFGYVARNVWEAKMGPDIEMPTAATFPEAPSGTPFPEDDMAYFARRYPKLHKRYWNAWVLLRLRLYVWWCELWARRAPGDRESGD
jgi:Protein of unknown function (DUF4240)